MPDGTYAPQSPDLSSFFSSASPPKISHPHPPQTSSYVPRSPNLATLSSTSGYQPSSPQIPNFASGSGSGGGSGSAYHPPTGHLLGHRQQHSFGSEGLGIAGYDDYGGGQPGGHLPTIPDLPPGHVESLQSPTRSQPQNLYTYQVPQQAPYRSQHPPQSQPPNQTFASHSPPQSFSHQSVKREDDNHTLSQYQSQSQSQSQYQPINSSQFPDGVSYNPSTMASRKRGAIKDENGQSGMPISVAGPGPSMGIEVKTKFPVARIKRIMQADEEVGKVAQVTPVAVSKALELFMISVVTKSATLARQTNSKRVTALHLKRAIEADEQFDFLSEIVGKVAEGPEAGGKRAKDEADSSDEGAKAVKKKRGGRKKIGE